MTTKPTVFVGSRDYEVLEALSKTPLEAKQLLKLSRTFVACFTHERLVRRRLQKLVGAGFLACFQYATTSAGAVNYYKLTKLGFRLLSGNKCELPTRRYFGGVSISLQEHTRALADFIVHTHVAAHAAGRRVAGFYRENELRLALGQWRLQPDAAFQIVEPGGQSFNYVVELDCATEPIRSTKQRDNLEQKISFYDRYQDHTTQRFRVLFLMTKPSVRIDHVLQTANRIVRDPQRTLVYATALPDYLAEPAATTAPVFLDHHGNATGLLPSHRRQPQQPTTWLRSTDLFMAQAASVW